MPTVIEVIPVPPESGGVDVESGGAYPLKYLVEFAEVHDNHTAAITATDGTNSIPAIGAQHPQDSSAYATGKQGVPDDENPTFWHVTVSYKVPTVNPDPVPSPDAPSTGSTASPTTSPIKNDSQSFKFWRKTAAAEKHINNLDILNSAGDPYDPAAPKEVFYAEFTMVRTQTTFDVQWALDYQDATNDKEFEFAGIKWSEDSLCVIDISESWPAGSTGAGHQVTIVIRADRIDLHRLVLLDAGFRKLVAGVPKPIVDEETGAPVTQPRRLNGAGAVLAAGNPSVYNTYQMAQSADFKKLYLSWAR